MIRTIRTHEDNALIKEVLASPGDGAVLVVDGGGSLRTALLGDMIATSAILNNWAGVILYGAVRDSRALAALELGIKALGTNPVKSSKAGIGDVDVPICLGSTTFDAGEWVYADDDGVLVSSVRLGP